MAKKKEAKAEEKPKEAEEKTATMEEEPQLETPKEGLATELGEVKEIEEVIVEEVKKKGHSRKNHGIQELL